LTGQHTRIEPARLGGGNHIGRRIDRDNIGAGGSDLLGQHAIATAEIEDTLARPGRQHDDRRAIGRHEMRRRRVTLRRPLLL
jgi:hypothetical protein